MEREFGIKELYDVTLKTTYPIEIDGKKFEIGEVVAKFDKIQISIFNEQKDFVTANGGYGNAPQVLWETTKEMSFSLTQGIFSKLQFALMSNSRLVTPIANSSILISQREEVEANENGDFWLSHKACGKVFVYDRNLNKLDFWVDGDVYHVEVPFTDCVVDYTYDYNEGSTIMIVGQRLLNGFLSLEGRTRVKDDITGHTKTGIIYIPKLKLMSELSMRLGENAMPLTGTLNAVAYPEGPRGSSRVMELYYLNNDIDSDM